MILLQLPQPLPFVDEIPQWLGSTLLLVGMMILVMWALKRVLPTVSPLENEGSQVLLLLLAVVGVGATTAGALVRVGQFEPFVLFLVAAGRFVEGGAAVRGLRKMYFIVTNLSLPGGTGSLRKRLQYIGIRAGIGFATLGLYLMVLVMTQSTSNLLYGIALTWTLSAFMLAVLGLSWKLESAEEQLAPSLILGLLAAFSGAQIFNYTNLLWDIYAIVIGSIAFLFGILTGLLVVTVDRWS